MALSINDILKSFQEQQQRANAANEARYQELLKTIQQTAAKVGGRFDQADQLLQDVGQSEFDRIAEDRARAQATAAQQLISRGLGNTTVTQTAARGINADAAKQRQALTEQIAAQRSGLLERRGAMEQAQGDFLAQMIEARSDVGPDLGLMAQLLQQLGQGQGMQSVAPAVIYNRPTGSLADRLRGYGAPASSSTPTDPFSRIFRNPYNTV